MVFSNSRDENNEIFYPDLRSLSPEVSAFNNWSVNMGSQRLNNKSGA
jgi:hypothetical protein